MDLFPAAILHCFNVLWPCRMECKVAFKKANIELFPPTIASKNKSPECMEKKLF
jgi:hypothetical protein